MANVGKVAELRSIIQSDPRAESISEMWTRYDDQRATKKAEWRELRNFLFATDTSTTSNATLPWKNKTTIPKLTQIRDNLHANYLSTLLPNDRWLKWEAHSQDAATLSKASTIEAYMSNKLREGEFRDVLSRLLYDYIDYGNAFADVEYIQEGTTDEEGNVIPGFIGPRIVRISPYDIVFDPTAASFEKTPKIIRSLITVGEAMKLVNSVPSSEINEQAVEKIKQIRSSAHQFRANDFNKAMAYTADGFGDMFQYFTSGFVELLTFEGDFYDPIDDTLYENYRITVADRSQILRVRPNPTWFAHPTIAHAGWRLRPDNLWAMGPLDNLVGMQYRIDHLENIKADAMDLIIHPPLKITGQVEDFEWGPNAEIHIIDGDVTTLSPDSNVLVVDNEIGLIENKMEEFAGAPRQAMGIRTPGEKTAFEVQALQNAASRIFEEKTRSFEINLVERLLNSGLEIARRNFGNDAGDVIRVIDDDLGVEEFLNVTREDITAKGKLRPIGARHFAAQAQLLQNLNLLANSQMLGIIQPHLSSKNLAKLIEGLLDIRRFDLFRENIGILEQADTQRLIQTIQGQLQQEGMTDIEEPIEGEEEVTDEELVRAAQNGELGGGQGG